VGIIGFDTSHVPAFTKLLNDVNDPFHVSGGKVVAGFPSFSPDVESSASRVEGYKKELIEKWKIEMVSSVEELLPRVDAVLLESLDGRRHLEEARPVIKAGKPLFIDKPMAASFSDAKQIFDMAAERGCPVFSSSSLRFDYNISRARQDAELGGVVGCDAFSPASLEPTNPGLFWYGIHGVEILYTFMGRGCKKLFCKKTDGTHFVTGEWQDGRIGTMRGTREGSHSYGATVYGENKIKQVIFSTEVPLYSQLLKQIIPFFQTGESPIPAEETLEIMQFIEAARLSENEEREVKLTEVK
jgi:predicted dehydrogenase